MFSSFPVARFFGVSFRVDWTWIAFVLGTAIFWKTGDPLIGLVNWLLIFVVVLLHEIGHTVMARALDIEVKDITLSFFGGYTRMGWGKRQEDPKAEILVALAGPAVNIVLGLVMLALFAATALQIDVDPERWWTSASPSELASRFCAVNLLLGVSNLLPVFPADGGRVFRAGLAFATDWLNATRIAAWVGRIAAVGLIVLGFVNTSWVAVLIGFLMWRACIAEVWMVRARRAQAQSADGLGRFGPAPAKFTEVQSPAASAGSSPSDTSGARRPADNPLERGAGQLDDDAIDKLEKFRGRLRRPDDSDESR